MNLPLMDSAEILASHDKGVTFYLKSSLRSEKDLLMMYWKALRDKGWKSDVKLSRLARKNSSADMVFTKDGKVMQLDITTGMKKGDRVQFFLR